jgi:hypothetical protein
MLIKFYKLLKKSLLTNPKLFYYRKTRRAHRLKNSRNHSEQRSTKLAIRLKRWREQHIHSHRQPNPQSNHIHRRLRRGRSRKREALQSNRNQRPPTTADLRV